MFEAMIRRGSRCRALTGMAIVLVMLAAGPLTAAPWTVEQKLSPADLDGSEFLGATVRAFGDTAFVSASHDGDRGVEAGSLYVYDRSGATWGLSQQVYAADASAGARFGGGFGVSGDTAVISASSDDEIAADAGAIYIFERAAGTWTQKSKLVSSDLAAGDRFGYFVDMAGDTLVASALNKHGVGAAYVFERNGGVWTQTAKLTPSDGGAGDAFGLRISMHGDTVVIGSPRNDVPRSNGGAAYIFTKPAGGWTDMTETAKLTTSDVASDDEFGRCVGIDGDTIVVSAHRDDDRGTDSGSAYVFDMPPGGWVSMTETAKLVASDGVAWERYGEGAQIDGDRIVVGSVFGFYGATRTGAAYVYERVGSAWTETAKLGASDGVAGDLFGCYVDLDDDYIIVGAYGDDGATDFTGAAYIYTPEPAALVLLGLGAAALVRKRRGI